MQKRVQKVMEDLTIQKRNEALITLIRNITTLNWPYWIIKTIYAFSRIYTVYKSTPCIIELEQKKNL